MKKSLLIVAGETSGDKHAAHLVESLKAMGEVHVVGIGGDRMKAAGVHLLHHVKEMSVMGFSEIITRLPFFRKVRHDLLLAVQNEKPSAVILVDYPGFNLRFAKQAKKNGLKVIYFISPQIWAWGKKRIKKIRTTVDLMLTIFKFEEAMYEKENVNAHFIGHPLLDEIKIPDAAEVKDFRQRFSKSSCSKFIALLPGSRLQEINRILPTMLGAVKILDEELKKDGIELKAVVGCAPGIDKKVYEEIIPANGINVQLSQEVELLMNSADAGIVTSGTATLESALHDLPILVVYKTSIVTYFIGKLLVKLKSISLVNIVAGQKIVEELVQFDFKPNEAAAILKDILINSHVSDEIRKKYSELRKILGGPGASDRAAELILKMI